MTILGLFAALLTIFAAGFGVTLLASRSPSAINVAEVCALSWLLGTGVVSLLLWLGGLILSGPALQLAVLCLTVALATLGWVRKPRARFFFPWPANAVERVLVTVIVLQCGFAVYLSGCNGLGWDGLFNWEIKARYAFLNDGVMPPSYYSDPTRFVTHPVYPLWIPFTELWLYLWMGEANQFWIKLIFPFCYAAGAVLLAIFATRLTGRRWIGLIAATFLFFVPCLTNNLGGVQVGYVDIPIGILYLAGIGFFLLYAETGAASAWRFGALFLALLPWAKKEGSLLWLIAAACALLVTARRGRRWVDLFWFLPGPVIIGGWKIFCQAMAIAPTHEFQSITLTGLRTNLPRLAFIWPSLFTEMVDATRWSIFWLITALAFGVLFFRARNHRFTILFIAVWAPIAIYTTSFVFSGWPHWEQHMVTSISRLLLHVVPLAWVAIALAIQPPSIRVAVPAVVEIEPATEEPAFVLPPDTVGLSRNR